uniref:RING-type domain-containing protein n=1 Tax=Chromera velia CCMP2878 TaxID=1169474 RepID=A0A0G4F0G8_9ALVE|eukprot:Cvel_14414.t1-p1 / transcript=Cvel_14414.t1 / gene=Cvel_14414 / organism=Chromera_velia_CCMP2878 / gene_product=E3 ubiquitin-protein ligase ORTHRUS-LIKE 1, putative / transcript_product=E3 ubiquitin-protein ligase ORTHRUS-LIKE 1, putative / location=Cvel_scaffold1024:54119-56547(-) / protein_length=211 / sequence_SO=supercontig / SO=protein_coding / is_pseudo=false
MPRVSISQVANAKDAEDLKCAICFQMPEDPRVVSCPAKHMFCNECFTRWVDKSGKICPQDRQRFTKMQNPTPNQSSTLKNTKYYCKHKRDGYKFVGTSEEVTKHEPVCPEAVVTCTVPNCDRSMKRKGLAAHNSNKKREHEQLKKKEICKLNADPYKALATGGKLEVFLEMKALRKSTWVEVEESSESSEDSEDSDDYDDSDEDEEGYWAY